ncbi:MAG: 50S ribosomal protein L25 [Acidimicrobiaceae bacterium]|jgi:large subunit ribosomal protein L25|nr:50S ribosomal protein L25 [Acidimicrobiaceae bacterium]MBT5579357.1 50S ribosomal protein L25 [Acidimicrobiaceae bacterium]MBT5849063.1 50S ribosomal protein L25 [Acidimicrobiaceae bacterium]MDG1411881.1 50S ribosomal protein L25 [Acidimicrobiales bacterium]MDG2216858.1 50S ribosomal protein L25 [Acidimicrobiales bacterium]
MSELQLSVETGRKGGTRPARRLRREGKIPAVVYGLETDPIPIAIEWPALRAALTTDAGLNALITLEIDGADHLTVIKDLQRHPVRRDVIHIDFMRIRADQEIEVNIPINLVGEALAVTRADGMVDQTMYELTLLTRPGNVPDEIVVDITDLQLGESIKVSDLPLPEGASAVADGDESVAISLITRSTREAMARDLAAESGDEAAEEDEAVADDSGESED